MDLQCALPRPNIVVLLVDRDDGAFEALSYISLDAPPPPAMRLRASPQYHVCLWSISVRCLTLNHKNN